MKQIWFKRAGWFYLPIHAMGMLITLCAIILMLTVCITVLRNGHTVTDDLYKMFVYPTCTAFWWKWIADKTSAS